MTSREINQFDVTFSDAQAVYRCGDVIKGNVVLGLSQEMKMKGIKLFVQGMSRVSWDEERAYTKGSASKLSHKNVDVYLDEPIVVLGRVDGNSMKPGRYEYPFTLRLPPYIPATFEGNYGRVQYWAKAVIDQPWKKNHEVTKNLTILGALDLNTESDARKPVDGTVELMAGLMCCKSGPITGQVSLSKRGFVSGQNIAFNAHIKNMSTKGLRNVHMSITQQVTFKADNQTRKTSNMLKGMTWRDVNPGEDVTWQDELKNIPSMVPSRLGASGCKAIDVKYLVNLTGKPKGGGAGLDVPVEIIIGTVPLRDIEKARTPIMTVRAQTRQQQQQQQQSHQQQASSLFVGQQPA